MKKYIQIIVAVVIVAALIWMARSGSAWASALPPTQAPVMFSEPVSAPGNPGLAPPLSLDITESGTYNIGGICILDVEYKVTNVKNEADAEIHVEESSKVPFAGDGQLLYPGCHVVHFKDGKIVPEAITQDGNWKVCFGDSPKLDKLRIYYYVDEPKIGRVWIPLETYREKTLVCAPAPFTGVYMPAGKPVEYPGRVPGDEASFTQGGELGSVPKPPSDITINTPGTYSAGGLCSAIIDYHIRGLGDNLHVEFPTEDNITVPFPQGIEDLFYLPGCHFLHYRDGKIKQVMTREEGDWEICFAARPGKEMTIYFYRDDNTDINPPWVALDTTTENGLACAPLADYSGVYAPAGK